MPSRQAKIEEVRRTVGAIFTNSKDTTQARETALLDTVSVVSLPSLFLAAV